MEEFRIVLLVISIIVITWAISFCFYEIRGLLISIGFTLLVIGLYLIWLGVTNNIPN